MVRHCTRSRISSSSITIIQPLADITEAITRPPHISPDNGAALQSDHISDSIDTEATQSLLNMLTNNPSTPPVNGPQNFVPIYTNLTKGNTHSTRVEGTPVMGGPPLTNLAQNLKTQVENAGRDEATFVYSRGNNYSIFLPSQLNKAYFIPKSVKAVF